MNSYKTVFLAFLLGVFFLVSACGASYKNTVSASMAGDGAYDMARAEQAEAPAAMREEIGNGDGGDAFVPAAEDPAQGRKLVKRAELHLRAAEPEAAEKILAAIMEKYGAWSASTSVYENSRNYSIRVPSPSYDAMLAELASLGRTLWRSENAEDVTLRYYDLESRLATRRELLKTYQSYLGKAANIDEIMTVESRIADLQQEIDRTGTQFKNLAGLVDYSTIDLEIAGPVSAPAYSGPTLGEKLEELFGSFGEVASSALVVLTGIVIFGVPAILVAALLFWLLFGRIGLLRKLWRLAAVKKDTGGASAPEPSRESTGEM